MRMGDAKHLQIATLSTAIPDLDTVLGKGLSKGHIIEIFELESAGYANAGSPRVGVAFP